MNLKLVAIGGIVLYLVTFAVSFATGPIIHNNVLKPTYKATPEFWRPELNQDPPDMKALMPRWVTTGLMTSFVLAGVYGAVRGAFAGPGWRKGMIFGFLLSLIAITFMASYSGVFNLPDKIWCWWAFESFFYWIPGGAALGWVGQKLAPERA